MKRYGYKITSIKPSLLKDYSGMNYEAAKILGFKPIPKKKEIYISTSLKNGEKTATIKHEIEETRLMDKCGLSYFDAHRQALRDEHETYPKFNIDYIKGLKLNRIKRR